MKPEQLLAILYEMAIVVGGEVRLQPLLTKTLQRLLFHTSFPCGVIFLRSEAASPGEGGAGTVEVRLETSIGDLDLAAHHGESLALTEALLRGGIELIEAGGVTDSIPCRQDYYKVVLRLPIDHDGVILLLAPRVPEAGLPLTHVFQPVMNNFAKAVRLCRGYDAYTEGIITDRRQTEEALKDMSYRQRLILDSVGEGICGLDLDGRATFVNPAAARLLDYEPAEIEGRTLHDFLHYRHEGGADDSFEDCPIIRAMKEGSRQQVAVDLFRRRDGSGFPVEYVATPLREDGCVVGAVLVFQDITARKQAEEDLQRLNEQLEQRVKDRTAALEEKNAELERMNRLFVGRELRMVELKTQIRELEEKLGDKVQ